MLSKVVVSYKTFYKAYVLSFRSLYKNFSISHGSTSIAIATKYSSLALRNELFFVVKRVILVLLIPVFKLTCDLFTDRCAKNKPKSVRVFFSFAAKRGFYLPKFTLCDNLSSKYFNMDTLCVYSYI